MSKFSSLSVFEAMSTESDYGELTICIENDTDLMNLSSKCKNLKKLVLKSHGKHGSEAIRLLFERCSKLREIDFGNSLSGSNSINGCTDQSVILHKISVGYIAWITEFCDIMSRILVPNCLLSFSLDACYGLLPSLFISQSNSLREVVVNNIDWFNLSHITTHCSNLTSLQFSAKDTLNDSSILEITSKLIYLEQLYIYGCDNIDTHHGDYVYTQISDVSFNALLNIRQGKLKFDTQFIKLYWPGISSECWDRIVVWSKNN